MRLCDTGAGRGLACLTLAVLLPPAAVAGQPRPLALQLTFDRSVSEAPFTGRVFVLLSRRAMTRPPAEPNWFNPEPMFAWDVTGWKPGEARTFGPEGIGYPTPLAKLAKGTYYAVAVMDFDRGGRSFGAAEGNAYSKPERVEFDPDSGGSVSLRIDQVYKGRQFPESERVKLVSVESRLLSAFHGRPVRMRAGVALPKSFATSPERRYPIVFEVPGFGGDHFGAVFAAARNATDVGGVEMIHVVLDPSCRLGHHVFADSANNGPWGRALCEELIPHIEMTYRGVGVPAARFLTGHSSGGWSSLWLQVSYPEFFGGTWSTAPDPVDFRDFQRIDVYRPGTNMFVDEQGNQRPLARRGGKPVLFYKPFSDMEVVMGHGGQLSSFEAVFSPRGPDGRPRPLWDRATGRVDREVAKAWEAYDIRLKLEREWPTLGPKLAGKLHVFMGADDTFYLDGATRLLKESLAKLGSDAVVEIVPGKDHGSLMDRTLRERIAREMAESTGRV